MTFARISERMQQPSAYQQTLSFLYRQLPMFQRIGPAAFKKDLTNTLALCAALHHPERRFRSIHLAGTNGKGSTAHLLAGALQGAGYLTGLYTSPHYRDFRERIKIDGQLMPRKEVVRFVRLVEPLIEELHPSFFELTVGMAFWYFAEEQVDWAVVETGLGGRLDSTNVITPELSLITNISFDHQDFLGDTLPAIAGEKAGIIKPGVPVVIGKKQAETRAVFADKAREMAAPLTYAADRWRLEFLEEGADRSWWNAYRQDQLRFPALEVNLAGPYQGENIVSALAALDLLAESGRILPLEEQSLRTAWKDLRSKTHFLGRWQLLSESPRVLVDSAHNEAGLRLAMERIAQLDYARLHLVFGTVSDKKIEPIFQLLPASAKYYFAKADVPRGLDAHILQEKAAAAGLQGKAYRSVRSALAAARRSAGPNDLIFVTGSIFVVAEIV